MAKSLFWVSFVLGLVLAACAPATLPPPIATSGSSSVASPVTTPGPSPLASPLEPQPAPQGISIIYHRSGGIAGTDDTWKITLDGTVAHQGQTAGTPEQLTTAQMVELTSAIRAANFMALEDSYVPQDTCCDRYTYEITVTVGSQSKTVSTIDASPTAPAELTQMIDTLNRLLIPTK